jgi:hypothetical protein
MHPDELLSDLTPCTTEASLLVAAARQQVRRRRHLRTGIAAAALLVTGFTMFNFLPIPPAGASSPDVTSATPPPSSPMLTEHELLDSFGDQPVALVTMPNGRKRLLSIRRPPVKRIASR